MTTAMRTPIRAAARVRAGLGSATGRHLHAYAGVASAGKSSPPPQVRTPGPVRCRAGAQTAVGGRQRPKADGRHVPSAFRAGWPVGQRVSRTWRAARHFPPESVMGD